MKSKLRKTVLNEVKALTDKKERSAFITKKFLSLPAVTNAETVALFMSTDLEPDTSSILSSLLEKGKKVFLPVTRGEEMYFVQITEKTSYVVGAFGITEPVGTPYLGSFDVMAVPLVAFDEKNNRLGHGKGFYDKYLSRYPSYTVGLAFSVQKKNVPVEPTDVPLNLILSY